MRQDEDVTLCRKTFGDKHYTDFSEFKIYRKQNEYFFHHKYEFAQNFFGKNGTLNNFKTDDNKINMNILNRPQRIRGFRIGLPDGRQIVNALVIIKNTEPYVYAFGLADKDKTTSTRR